MSLHRGKSRAVLSLTEIVDAGIHTVEYVVKQILEDVDDDPVAMLDKVRIGDREKKALVIDKDAEDSFRRELHKYHRNKFSSITVYGEERLDDKNLDLTDEPGIFALVDMVDGTDLLERGLSNWCSAAVFFCPMAEPGRKILAAFVGLPSKEIYYASADDETVYVKPFGSRAAVPVKRPSKVKQLKNASVCFYGQKCEGLQSITSHRMLEYVIRLNNQQKDKRKNKKSKGESPSRDDEDVEFRIYTLAGIPMVVKLIDHKVRTAKNIDVVFDVRGQNPHDVVPGAFLAKKAGATVMNLVTGEPLTMEDLESALLRPAAEDSKLKYVIAATSELCDELLPLISPIAQRIDDTRKLPDTLFPIS